MTGKEVWRLANKARMKSPDLFTAYEKVTDEVYRDRALSRKNKRLMSLAIAVKEGCESCIVAQTDWALESGASVEEILETGEVAISMGGTRGMSDNLKLLRYLEELGLV
ncbi:MAG: carboxymuconolactone decarboxylase family protein [Spirochaetaceae bacterium]